MNNGEKKEEEKKKLHTFIEFVLRLQTKFPKQTCARHFLFTTSKYAKGNNRPPQKNTLQHVKELKAEEIP